MTKFLVLYRKKTSLSYFADKYKFLFYFCFFKTHNDLLEMKKNIQTQFIFIPIFLFFSILSLAQNTIVKGKVLDAKDKTGIPYASLQFGSGNIGTNTDNNGFFLLEKKGQVTEIRVSCMGYVTQTIAIKPNQTNEITVSLVELEAQLREITVRPEKYKRKNPAVDLIKQVFAHRDQNRKEGLDYYQFDKHERLRFDMDGVTTRFKNQWYFNKFRFAFDYCDTNKVNQRASLPFYFRERLLTSYYRQRPKTKKERLHAERQTALENDYDVDQDGISTYINNMYSDVDIYEPTITLLNKEFMGPLSGIATSFYRFYITDTVSIDNQRFASVFFSPINKNDLAFMGNILISLDSTYAVRQVDMGVSKDINLNWVSDIKIKQDFAFQGEGKARRLLMTEDVVVFNLKIWKNKEGRSMLATKVNNYKNYILDKPEADSLYKGKVELLRDTGYLSKKSDFWEGNRHQALNQVENEIKEMVDSVKHVRLYKILTGIGTVLGSGYQKVGKIEIGQVGNLFRYNDVEGFRVQLDTRTNDRYFRHFRLRGYGAYGFLDKAWKYGASTTISFRGARPSRFPVNQLKVSYEHDLFFPGLGSNLGQGLVSSLQVAGTNRLLLNEITKLEYSREFTNGMSYSIYGQRKAVSEAGASLSEPSPNTDNVAVTTEVGGWYKYSPNEKFYQGAQARTRIKSKYPVFYVQYKAGIKGILGGEYAFQRVSLRMDKTFYLAPIGQAKCYVETGKIFGQVSYPLLEIHRANRGYIFDNFGFNLMNYLEFVSDRYAMIHVNHDFGGLVLNRIPLIKKLKLREGLTFKALYGSLSEQNIPSANNRLLAFPLDLQKQPLTHPLGKLPYMEASAGIGNIFGFLRMEYIWRLTYNDLPNVQKWGVKAMFGFDF